MNSNPIIMTPANPKDYIALGIFVGKTFLFPKRSIRLVMDNLMQNEEIILMAGCNALKKGAGVIAVTNKRVIFGSKILFTSSILDFDLSKITSVSYSCDMNNNKLVLKSSFDTLVISAIEKKAGQQIVNKIKELEERAKKPQSSSNNNSLDMLENLAALKEKGIITEEEFAAKKKALLGI